MKELATGIGSARSMTAYDPDLMTKINLVLTPIQLSMQASKTVKTFAIMWSKHGKVLLTVDKVITG